MRNAGLEETLAGIKMAGRNINNLRYTDEIFPKGKSRLKAKRFEWNYEGDSGTPLQYSCLENPMDGGAW